MTKLKISDTVLLPPDVITSTTIVYGGKGMGKTNLLSVLVEEMSKAGLRWCVLDPMGVCWGLRHSADGKGPGIECVILGGAHGDIPIEPTGGAIVADLVVDEGVNTIIDFSRKPNGKMWSVGERIRFVTDYTVRLFERQGELVDGRRREPLLQVLDEAARYIPQTIPHGSIDLAKCVGAWEQVCEEGRNIGLGVAFITQRSARMNKSVSELADVMFAFRTLGPNSLTAVMDWLGDHVEKSHARELAGKVRELNVGEALVVSPGWLRLEKIAQIRPRETFDSSATPKPGERARRVTGRAAKPDLAAYQLRMAETIEKQKADDPKELKKEIAALKKQLAAGDVGKVDSAAVRSQIDAAVSAARAESSNAKQAASELVDFIAKLQPDLRAMSVQCDDAIARYTTSMRTIASARHAPARPPVAAPRPQSNAVQRSLPPQRESRHAPSSSAKIGGTSQRMLNALRFLETVGTSPAPRAAIAGLLSLSWDTGSFRNNVSELRTAGYISDYADGALALTEDGRAQASDEGLPTSRRELHAAWKSKLSGTTAKMFSIILDAYPHAVERADIAAALNLSWDTGSFRNNLSEMRSPGLITDPSKTAVRASDALFPEGLPE